jgi:glycolate oxidase iron-sulfur subunit
MRTNFRADQLADPHLAEAEHSFRACVHCGFCTATCPTYLLLGDERDSPRGRIQLMQNMLEKDATPSPETVLHLDRCLSCLGCRTTCPSDVDYSVLIDTARVHIANRYRRPFTERAYRAAVLYVLSHPRIFAFVLALGRVFAPVARLLPGKLGSLARKVPPRNRFNAAQRRAALQPASPKRDIALLPGCVQRVLAPQIDLAAARVLARQGDAVRALPKSGCCGALAFHMGKADEARTLARALMAAVESGSPQAAIVLNTASGCAAFLKEYPRLFLGESDEARAKAFAAKVRDFSELVSDVKELEAVPQSLRVAYHPPCSLQHGQRLKGQAEAALQACGFTLMPFAEEHLCCGSAGSYSLLQPEISAVLRARKLAALNASGADVIVSGNIGCLTQLSGFDTSSPAFHLAELLDHATGGATPETLKTLASKKNLI